MTGQCAMDTYNPLSFWSSSQGLFSFSLFLYTPWVFSRCYIVKLILKKPQTPKMSSKSTWASSHRGGGPIPTQIILYSEYHETSSQRERLHCVHHWRGPGYTLEYNRSPSAVRLCEVMLDNDIYWEISCKLGLTRSSHSIRYFIHAHAHRIIYNQDDCYQFESILLYNVMP